MLIRIFKFWQQMRWGSILSLSGLLLCSLYSYSVHAQEKKLPVVSHVELDKYLGLWYEVARKPIYFQQQCIQNVTARYTLNENGNVVVDNRCEDDEAKEKRSVGEAFVINQPYNSKLRVSFIPEAIRWLPVGRGDYWILKIDKTYQMALVGEPHRKYLWVLSRDPKPNPHVLSEYLKYASSLGYQLDDVIYTKQSHP